MSSRYRLPVFTDELLSEIIFAMEDQDKEYSLDLKDGTVYSDEFGDQKASGHNLVELPPWNSADGFQLMVNFTNACKDHGLQLQLSRELGSKRRGVFRRFRDILAQDKEAQQSWYDFKDSRMKAYIKSWYRKNHGELFKVNEESDALEAGDLLADFEVRHLAELDEYSSEILNRFTHDDAVQRKIMECFKNMEAFIVMSSDKAVGTLVYEIVDDCACVLCYYVEPGNRGNGLFSLLFDMFNREVERRHAITVRMPFGQDSAFFRNVIVDHGVEFKQCRETVIYSPKQWNDGTESSESAYVL